MQTYEIAEIGGDGIGPDVIASGKQVLDAAGALTGSYRLNYTDFPWGCEYYLQHDLMMPADALQTLEQFQAIYLGAVGFPTVPDHVSLWGLLLPIRKAFRQYVNLRPIKLLRGIDGPLRDKGPEDVDFVCVRENTEGEYSGVGGRVHVGTDHEVALQTIVFTRTAVERIIRYAFDYAQTHGRTGVTSITKSNAMQYNMVFWDEVFLSVAQDYPDIATSKYHVDAAAARFVTSPESFDVVVASNLFADILTDLGGALQGSLGLPPSANIDPTRRYPGMFEPVHGSAPDIHGKNIANPLAAIWAGAMMLDYLGEHEAGELVMTAMEAVTASGGPAHARLGGNRHHPRGHRRRGAGSARHVRQSQFSLGEEWHRPHTKDRCVELGCPSPVAQVCNLRPMPQVVG